MAKKGKEIDVEAEEVAAPEGRVIYFIANAASLDPLYKEYLRDKTYITINNSFRHFKNFLKMAFTNQYYFDLFKDGFWRLDKAQQDNFIIGSDELPIEIALMGEFSDAYLVGYDDNRFKQVQSAYEQAENISTQIHKLELH